LSPGTLADPLSGPDGLEVIGVIATRVRLGRQAPGPGTELAFFAFDSWKANVAIGNEMGTRNRRMIGGES
jgi:hypothetical protein